jgi:hypothetical protein
LSQRASQKPSRPASKAIAMRSILRPAFFASSRQRCSSFSNALSSTASFFNGWRSTHGEYLPGLAGKKGVIITTSGANKEELRSGGTLRALRTIYDEGLMQFCGIEMVQHLYLSGIDPSMSEAEGEKRLANIRRFVRRTF